MSKSLKNQFYYYLTTFLCSTERLLDRSGVTVAPPERDRSASVSLPPTPTPARSRERRSSQALTESENGEKGLKKINKVRGNSYYIFPIYSDYSGSDKCEQVHHE